MASGYAPGAGAAPITWVGTTGDWATATNWSSNPALPGSADDVTINVPGTQTVTVSSGTARSVSMTGNETLVLAGGAFSVSQPSTFANLTMNSGSSGFTAGTNSVITGNATLQGGISGTTTVQGATTLVAGPGLTTAFRISGVGSSLNNAATGVVTWNTATESYLNLDDSPAAGGGTFNNNGLLVASGSGFKDMDNNYGGGAFNNAGTVDVQGGILQLLAGGTHAGSFSVSGGATLQFGNSGSGGINNLSNAPTGAGTLQVRGGTVNANGGVATAGLAVDSAVLAINAGSSVTTFSQGSGTLSGTGTLTVSGAATLSGGTQSGTGTTVLQGNTAASSGNVLLDAGRTVRNAATGVFTWGGSASMELDSTAAAGGGAFVNQGLFIAAKTFASSINNTNGSGSFSNQGTFRNTGVVTVTIAAPFSNAGTVDVQAGKLVLAGGTSTHSGAFSVAGGSALQFNGGTHTLASAATGTGTVSVAGGTTLAVQGAFTNQGVLAGNGTYDPLAASGLMNAGTISPGDNYIGALTVAGDLSQLIGGTMSFELASLSSFDTLNVVGNLALGGTFEVRSLGGYNPVNGDSFTVITFDDGIADASDLSGVFASIVATNFGPLVSFNPTYLNHSIVLTASVAVVPVPAAVWLFGGALGLLGVVRRRVIL